MNREHREWTERFSDYLAGELDMEDSGALQAHIAQCGACRLALEQLREVVAEARGLPELTPPRDLWPGIVAAIQRPPQKRPDAAGARVIALPTSGEVPRGRGHVVLSTPQLAAAAVVLITVSAMTTWWVGPGVAGRADAPLAAVEATPITVPAALSEAPQGLASELTALEDVLEAARPRLDPNTVRVLERNLSVIEQAIADSRRALALDPDNDYLSAHLERAYERKLAYLRDAARVIDWAG